jgi:hypothetical protein
LENQAFISTVQNPYIHEAKALHLLLLLLANSDSLLSIDFCETHESRLLFRTASTSWSTTCPYFPAITSIAIFENNYQITCKHLS